MAHVGKKLTLQPDGFFGLFAGGFEFACAVQHLLFEALAMVVEFSIPVANGASHAVEALG